MKFEFNQLSEEIYSSLVDLGYEKPTEIQEKAIPILRGEDTDFVGQAQTGTGKTAAFCLPLLEKLNFKQKGVQALILSPTRELANQINQELKKFGKRTFLRTAILYGGVGYKDQLQSLRSAHVVIATPGRAIDLLDKGKLILDKTKYFIVDEADEMLNMGFIRDVDKLMSHISKDSCAWMFSATMPKPIIRLMEQKLNNPHIVKVKKQTLSNKNVSQSYIEMQKRDFLGGLSIILQAEDNFYGIVFCETKRETKKLTASLTAHGENVVSLHGDLSQKKRDLSMKQFKDKKSKILVCTDVGARGLDVSQVTHVINMGLPRNADSYVHRIGRTGRAGEVGKAISFVSPDNKKQLRAIEKLINDKIDKFIMPSSSNTKEAKVKKELEKMIKLKSMILSKGDDFSVDESFDLFDKFMVDMNKEQALKLIFSFFFNSDLTKIGQPIDNTNYQKSNSNRDGNRGSRNRNDRAPSTSKKRSFR